MIAISISEGDPSVHSGFPGSIIDTEKLCVPSTDSSSSIPIAIQSCEPILEPAAKVTSNCAGTLKSWPTNITNYESILIAYVFSQNSIPNATGPSSAISCIVRY